ncbi:MAG: HD domain-containing protein [Planctomycetota bacterium]
MSPESRQRTFGGPAAAGQVDIQKVGKDLVSGLFIAIKTARIHGSKNSLFFSAVDGVHQRLHEAMEIFGSLEMRLTSDCLFLNDSRLRIGFESYNCFRFLIQILREHQIGSLRFSETVLPEQIRILVEALGVESPADEPFERLHEVFERTSQGIEAEPYQEGDADEVPTASTVNRAEKARGTYLRSLFVTWRILESIRQRKDIDLRRVKRVVQDIVDTVLEDEPTLLAMTTIRDHDHRIFQHSVNVCILSVLLGQAAGLGKKQLGDLGVAALLHDVGLTVVSKDLLERAGELSLSERAELEAHPRLGVVEILRQHSLSLANLMAVIVSYEHHDVSGSGDFDGNLPNLYSRIVRIADHYDRATTTAVYGEPLRAVSDVLAELLTDGGVRFDPVLARLFVQVLLVR